MIQIIMQWLVPFLLGALISFITSLLKKNKALQEGLCCLLRAQIIQAYDKYTTRGCIPLYAKEALVKEYKAYHSLGGNDVATELYDKLMELPVRK